MQDKPVEFFILRFRASIKYLKVLSSRHKFREMIVDFSIYLLRPTVSQTYCGIQPASALSLRRVAPKFSVMPANSRFTTPIQPASLALGEYVDARASLKISHP